MLLRAIAIAVLAVILVEGHLFHQHSNHTPTAIFHNTLQRLKRQTFVSSSGNANGTGEAVNGSASAYHYKNEDGTIGMNVSSAGNASGTNGASIANNGQGTVGNSSLNAVGNVNATGANSNVFSNIFAQIYGGMQSITNTQQGGASGTGDTAVVASGQSGQVLDGNGNPLNSNETKAAAGATGSEQSSVNVLSNQTLTWDTLSAALAGSATGKGAGHAQSNIDLGAGNANNGVEVNGLVSGVNQGGGKVDTQVNGSANMTGTNHNLTGNLAGSVEGSGPSQLVAAGNLQSNVSGVNQTISSFGDAKTMTNGTNNMNLASETNNGHGTGVNGEILTNSTANGGDKNMTVQNGLQVNDGKGGTLAVGFGSITGNGTENSNGTITVDSKYNENGQAQVVAQGTGQAISNEKNSSLNIGGNAMLQTNGSTIQGNSNANGQVMGAHNNLTGNGLVSVDSSGTSGHANMEANGGGAGPSAAETNVNLHLNDRNSSVSGSVAASGDQTSVHSVSSVTDNNGVQTLSNLQQASSSSKGASSVSASNSGWLKRRKRASLGVLFDKLF